MLNMQEVLNVPNAITCHWSGGGYNSVHDSYHYCITFNPKTKKAKCEKTCDNDSDILAHTWHRNTDNIGISLCCGLNMTENTDGDCPPTIEQIEMAAAKAGELAHKYNIPADKIQDHAYYAELDGYYGERWDCRKYIKGYDKNVFELWKDKTLWYKENYGKEVAPPQPPASTIDKLITKYSAMYNLNPVDAPTDAYVRGVITAESSFNPKAVSSSNAKGLMQLLDSTFREQCQKIGLPENSDPFDPDTNIRCGCFYLNWLGNQLFPGVVKRTKLHCFIMSVAYNQGLSSTGIKYARKILSLI